MGWNPLVGRTHHCGRFVVVSTSWALSTLQEAAPRDSRRSTGSTIMISVGSLSGRYACLSLDYKRPVLYEGRWYPTSQHGYQSQKTTDPKRSEEIRLAPSAGKAALWGRDRRKTILRHDWNEDDVLYTFVFLKFAQNEDLWLVLEGTGETPLNDEKDPKNTLGKALMRTRDELRAVWRLMGGESEE